ncbi:hypothetical protein PoB_004914800 [Plakobranchus ocellatus]|uniref:Uncharacterized protein n=1 Tax=Plakobranchus ocellatus TaxID=259542 RepID=A0AAV4BSR1_9GAST|nr:hypothetical protein PoB_004914800 [Plakobranchus ocellatus]
MPRLSADERGRAIGLIEAGRVFCFDKFMQQLPDYVRAPLANSTTSDYLALAQEADKLFIVTKLNKTSQDSSTFP